MECFWRVLRHWRPDGNCYKPDPAIFYVCFAADDGLSHHYLYGACLLAKHEKLYEGGEKESVVLFVKLNGQSLVVSPLAVSRLHNFRRCATIFPFTILQTFGSVSNQPQEKIKFAPSLRLYSLLTTRLSPFIPQKLAHHFFIINNSYLHVRMIAIFDH